MAKQVIETYTFSTSAKTVTLGDFSVAQPVVLDRLYLITDVTINKILYNFASSTIASATVSSNNVITLSALPAGTANADHLQIIYETLSTDPVYETPLLSANAAKETGGNLATIVTDLTNGTQVAVPVASASAQGLSVNFQSALSTTVQSVKSSAGRLYGYNIFNPGTSLAYVQIFNVASGSVTLGTTTPVMSIALPSNTNASIGDDLMYTIPISFSTAISCAATTTPTGSTAPGSALIANLYYI